MNAAMNRTPRVRVNTDGSAFERAASEAVQVFRLALGRVVMDVGVAWSNHNDFADVFRISKNLAWKLTRVLGERDALAALPMIPGKDAIEQFAKRASVQGANSETIKELYSALAGIDRFIETHAGDRASLELLAASADPDQDSSIAINHRKSAYIGNGFIWGVQAKAQYRLGVIRQAAHDARIAQSLMVGGLVSLRKTRKAGSWAVSRSNLRREVSPDSAGLKPPVLEPIDPSQAAALLPEFCSQPIPEITSIETADAIEHRIENWPVGDTGAVTVFTGEVVREVGLSFSAVESYAISMARLHTPAELFVFDLLIQHQKFETGVPSFHFISDLGLPLAKGKELYRALPVPGPIAHLGTNLQALSMREVPRCAELAASVLGRLGWDNVSYDIYRVVVRYPPIATSAVMRLRLPETC